MLESTSSSPHRESDFPRFDLSNWTHIWMDSHLVRDREGDIFVYNTHITYTRVYVFRVIVFFCWETTMHDDADE